MDALSGWLQHNWFSALQAIGIIGGLVFTAVSIRQATQARKVSDLLTLTEQHRELWDEVYKRLDLGRVLDPAADLVAKPVTVTEERFLNEVIVHVNTGWQLAKNGSLLTLESLAADVRGLFSLPIPRAVWKESRGIRDPAFVEFVEGCLERPGAD